MRMQHLSFAFCLMTAAACSRTESVVAAVNGGTERYILLVSNGQTQDGNCTNSAPDPNSSYVSTTTGDTKTELLATIYKTDDANYLLSVVQNYYSLSIPALPVLSGTKSDSGYSFTGTTTHTDVGPGTATPDTAGESYVYTVKIAAGKNKNFDSVTGSMETHHTESCSGPNCDPNAYLADCNVASAFSGVRLTNVVTTVGP